MEVAVLAGSGEAGPEFVQSEVFTNLSYYSGRKTPIFLIHDGGGTTFTYHLLESQGRFVYAIANPRWESCKPFEGGLPEMGRIYTGYIRETVKKVGFPAKRHRDGRFEIFLGGWSLGGLLSLEVARQLAHDPRIKVTGVVMIDSVYDHLNTRREFSAVGFQTDETGKTKNQILVQRAMTEARRMISSWDYPTWEGKFAQERPRTILLRAMERVPTKEEEGPSSIDSFRDDPQLGWGDYMEDFLEDVVDIPGDHFTLAELPNISTTSAALKKACGRLDSPRR
jgi:thioesterase domain-containing protein